ncbi:hypothetical protein NEOLEDRAFT_1162072 [Neolentinus lepideus HHB14362 ss-1]|uniref:Uncharacterized protein n=1 Tax=Neolentinus lepideus HHB14362 ss-1 TaxID=1314782 RepID=A0A165TL57_9AGAM|nr:hypothetical protein NEOLEDRAFT_1162072 [Neolentinus lepideus HHB14362 ss-1]
MLSNSQRLLARHNARGIGKSVYRQGPKRFQSTASTSQSSMAPYVAAGAAGGLVVVGSAYTYYHFSSLKTLVDTSKSAKAYLQQAQEAVKEKAKNPNEALAYLRQVAKSYIGLVPGLSSYVDATFDSFDQLADKHGDEVNAIAKKGYDEIQGIIQENGGKADMQTATKIVNDLAKRAGGDAMEPLLEKYPQLKEKFGGGYQQFKELVFDDTKKQVVEIFSKGMSQDALNQAQDLVRSKSSEISKLAESSAKQAWDKGLNQAQPYLDKLPEIRQTLEENVDAKFIAAGAAALPTGSGDVTGSAKEVFDRIREVAESKGRKQKEKVEELKKFVQEKATETEEKGKGGLQNGWDSLVSFIKMLPGGEEVPIVVSLCYQALEKTPNVKEFMKVSHERSDDAKQTYEEILRVLEEKGKKAKKLAEETGKDVQQRSQ